MKKRALVIISLCVILLSSCITIRVENKINADGSGEKSVLLALDKSMMSMFESMAAESGESMDDIWAEARTGAEAIEGAKVEDYSDDDVEGIKMIVPFDSLDELQALSQSETFEGIDTITVSEDGDTKTLKAQVDVGELTSGLGEAGGAELEGFDLGDIELEYTYAVEVEGKILDHSPKDIAEVKGGKVTWDLVQSNSQTVELMVKWSPGGGGINISTILLIVIVAGGLVLVAVGVFLALRGRRSPDQFDSPDQFEAS